jgi:hypothetical protein
MSPENAQMIASIMHHLGGQLKTDMCQQEPTLPFTYKQLIDKTWNTHLLLSIFANLVRALISSSVSIHASKGIFIYKGLNSCHFI